MYSILCSLCFLHFSAIEALIVCPAQRSTSGGTRKRHKIRFCTSFRRNTNTTAKSWASQSLRFAIMLMTNPPGRPLPVRPGRPWQKRIRALWRAPSTLADSRSAHDSTSPTPINPLQQSLANLELILLRSSCPGPTIPSGNVSPPPSSCPRVPQQLGTHLRARGAPG